MSPSGSTAGFDAQQTKTSRQCKTMSVSRLNIMMYGSRSTCMIPYVRNGYVVEEGTYRQGQTAARGVGDGGDQSYLCDVRSAEA